MDLFLGFGAAFLTLVAEALDAPAAFFVACWFFDTAFFDTAFFDGVLVAAAFSADRPRALAAGFLAADFLAADFLIAGFLATDFLVAGFLATDFLATGFLEAAPFFAPPPWDVLFVTGAFFAAADVEELDFLVAAFLAPCAFLLGATVCSRCLLLSVSPGPPGQVLLGNDGSPSKPVLMPAVVASINITTGLV
ncbi:MAG: hypothetical protein GY773_05965 [Actinomycetia bacterium]|nr:hypothetical protein [Actinomycetes bacterium]